MDNTKPKFKIGQKVVAKDLRSVEHNRPPDRFQGEGIVRDLFAPHGRQTAKKDKIPPYFVEGTDGRTAWYDEDELQKPDRHERNDMASQELPEHMIEDIRRNYETIDKIDPVQPAYVKLIGLLDKLPQSALKQLALAKIKFISNLAKNRIQNNSLTAEIKGIYRARAVEKETSEEVSWGPGSAESAQHKATLWFGSNDYRSVRVERSLDNGKTWKRI